MRGFLSVCAVFLALLSRVSADEAVRAPARVFATIPNDQILSNVPLGSDVGSIKTEQKETRAMRDVEITGFITKTGDIFELSDDGGMGSIESRQASEELEPGMSMCRYGTIVVYSDTDCNTFFKPSQNLGLPSAAEDINGNKADQSYGQTEQKLQKKRKAQRNKLRKPNKKQLQRRRKNQKNKNNKRKNQMRRKALKRRGNQNRRRNQKRRQNLQNRNKQQNQRRGTGNRKNVKRKRIQNNEMRSPLSSSSDPQRGFTILYGGRQ